MDNLISGTSSDVKVAEVKGECTGGGGIGVWGVGDCGHGVHRSICGDSSGKKGEPCL
jgi:hypothetical protein